MNLSNKVSGLELNAAHFVEIVWLPKAIGENRNSKSSTGASGPILLTQTHVFPTILTVNALPVLTFEFSA